MIEHEEKKEAQGKLTRSEVRAIVDRLCENFSCAYVLKTGTSRVVVRVGIGDGRTLIAKLWSRSAVCNVLRRASGTHPLLREERAMNRLRNAGVEVPRPVGYCRVKSRTIPYTDALLIEDVGFCETGMSYLKAKLKSTDLHAADSFESDVIVMTERILSAGFVDTDHSMINIVVPQSGVPTRLDLEGARWVGCPWLAYSAYSEMLGRLIGTYVFTVQPNIDRAQQFSQRLIETINPSRTVLKYANAYLSEMLEKQYQHRAIRTQFHLRF